MRSVRAIEPFKKAPGDGRNWGFNFTKAITLPANTTISSVSSVTVVHVPQSGETTEDPVTLEVANQVPNSVTYEQEIVRNGEVVGTTTVAVGKAVKADVTGGTAGKNYDIRIVVQLSTGEPIEGIWPVYVRQ